MFFFAFSLARCGIYETYFGKEDAKRIKHYEQSFNYTNAESNFYIRDCRFDMINGISIQILENNKQKLCHVIQSTCKFTNSGQCIHNQGYLECIQYRFEVFNCSIKSNSPSHVTSSKLYPENNINQKNFISQASIYLCGDKITSYPIIDFKNGAIAFDNTNCSHNQGDNLITLSSNMKHMSYSIFEANSGSVLFYISYNFTCEMCIFNENYFSDPNSTSLVVTLDHSKGNSYYYYKKSNFIINNHKIVFLISDHLKVDNDKSMIYIVECYMSQELSNSKEEYLLYVNESKNPIPIQIRAYRWNQKWYDQTNVIFYGFPKFQEHIKNLKP